MPDTSDPDPRELVETARREGRDTRPALLRLLVERYAADGRHSAAEQDRFCRLALRLLDAADTATAAHAAARLAARRDLPYAVALRLAQGPIEVAAPLLRASPALDDVSLQLIAETGSAAHAAAIAVRREVSPALAKRLAAVAHEARAELPPPLAATELPDPDGPPSPADFLHAAPGRRATILEGLVTLPPLPMGARIPRAGAVMLERMEQVAQEHRPGEFAALLARALRVPDEVAGGIVADETGEALIVAARALGMPFELASRLVFLLHAGAGRSAARVFRLAELHETLSEMHAQQLAAAWRGGRRTAPRPDDAPSMRGFGEARRAVAAPTEAERRRLGQG